ncbi:MAG: FG-GAP repeat protein [Myxococcota bacterium]
MRFLAHLLLTFAVACGGDAGDDPDADPSPPDAGARDATPPDAGARDPSPADAGATDAGDAGAVDRGGPEATYIKSPSPGVDDELGGGLAAHGDRVAVGAPGESSDARGVGGDADNDRRSQSGAVFTYRAQPDWTLEAYVKAPNPSVDDRFGAAVALQGDLLAVGAELEDSSEGGVDPRLADDDTSDSGAVYLYRFDGASWSLEAALKAPVPARNERFGAAVSVFGDRVAVGTPGEDASGGAVHLYARTDGAWMHEATLTSTPTEPNAFGNEVDLEADTLAVASLSEPPLLGGAVYVFERHGSTWVPQVRLTDNVPFDGLGSSLSVEGDRLLAGQPLESSGGRGVNAPLTGSRPASGAARLYARDPRGNWSLELAFKAENAEDNDLFGTHCALREPWIACGAIQEDAVGPDPEDNSGDGVGAVYVYRRGANGWVFVRYLKPELSPAAGNYGLRVALSELGLFVSHRGDQSASSGVGANPLDASLSQAGAVYFFPYADLERE